MRKSIFNALIIICLYQIAVSCGLRNREKSHPDTNVNVEKKSPGKIVFETEIHNFGSLKDGEIVAFSFKFQNKGGRPFKIIKAEKSCGCIDIQYDQNEVLPGAGSFVTIVFNSSGEWGNSLKEATIETSDGEKKELQIGAYIDNKQFNNLLNTQK